MQQSAHAVRSRARVQGALESTLQAAERRASFLALGKLSGAPLPAPLLGPAQALGMRQCIHCHACMHTQGRAGRSSWPAACSGCLLTSWHCWQGVPPPATLRALQLHLCTASAVRRAAAHRSRRAQEAGTPAATPGGSTHQHCQHQRVRVPRAAAPVPQAGPAADRAVPAVCTGAGLHPVNKLRVACQATAPKDEPALCMRSAWVSIACRRPPECRSGPRGGPARQAVGRRQAVCHRRKANRPRMPRRGSKRCAGRHAHLLLQRTTSYTPSESRTSTNADSPAALPRRWRLARRFLHASCSKYGLHLACTMWCVGRAVGTHGCPHAACSPWRGMHGDFASRLCKQSNVICMHSMGPLAGKGSRASCSGLT